MHRAVVVEVVVLAVDGAVPPDGIAIFVKIIGLSTPNNPCVNRILAIFVDITVRTALFDQLRILLDRILLFIVFWKR